MFREDTNKVDKSVNVASMSRSDLPSAKQHYARRIRQLRLFPLIVDFIFKKFPKPTWPFRDLFYIRIFLTTCQSVEGYFMHRCEGIAFIERLYLQFLCCFSVLFFANVSTELKLFSNRFIWTIYGTLFDINTPVPTGPGSNVIERVVRSPQSTCTGVSPLNAVKFHTQEPHFWI